LVDGAVSLDERPVQEMEEDDWLLEAGRLKSPLSALASYRSRGRLLSGGFVLVVRLGSRHRIAACLSICNAST
jgi:hypothetical protein